MAGGEEPKFLTQAEFARHRSVSRKAVTVWKSRGLLVLNAEGKVDVEATEWKLDDRPATYRGGVTHRPIRKPDGNNSNGPPTKTRKAEKPARQVPPPASRPSDGTPDPDGFDLDDPNLPTPEAIRRKENMLGLKHKHDFEVSKKEWVRVEDIGREVEQRYAMVRERLLAIPGKLAAGLEGMNRAEIEAALQSEVDEALTELHDV